MGILEKIKEIEFEVGCMSSTDELALHHSIRRRGPTARR